MLVRYRLGFHPLAICGLNGSVGRLIHAALSPFVSGPGGGHGGVANQHLAGFAGAARFQGDGVHDLARAGRDALAGSIGFEHVARRDGSTGDPVADVFDLDVQRVPGNDAFLIGQHDADDQDRPAEGSASLPSVNFTASMAGFVMAAEAAPYRVGLLSMA